MRFLLSLAVFIAAGAFLGWFFWKSVLSLTAVTTFLSVSLFLLLRAIFGEIAWHSFLAPEQYLALLLYNLVPWLFFAFAPMITSGCIITVVRSRHHSSGHAA